MKIIKFSIIGILGIQFLMFSCTSVYVSEIYKSQDLKSNLDNSKTALIVGNDAVSLNDFIKTFNKKYNQKRNFVNDYLKIYAGNLRASKIFGQVSIDTTSHLDFINSISSTQEQLKTVDSLFTNTSAYYLIVISDFDISNRYETIMMGGGPNMPMTTSSKEFCIMKSRFQVYEIKTRQKVLEFVSTGESSVFLFAFESALIGAMNNSIDHSVTYLKTGQTKF